MARQKKIIKGFSIDPGTEEEQCSLAVLDAVKQKDAVDASAIAAKTGLDAGRIAECINNCVKSELVKISGEGGPIDINGDHKKVLGVGFTRKEAILALMSLTGEVEATENIPIANLYYYKGKVKELKAIVSDISARKGTIGEGIRYVGIAVPDFLVEKNPKAPEILGDGIAHVFNCDALLAAEATASGYGEKDAGSGEGKDLAYLHADVGLGVVIKGEMIFEAAQSGGNADYLRSWKQFSAVETTKDLINKGVGTDIVNMLDGDLEELSLEVVLDAAERKDELAEDLVKRAGLALGVRAAYLVNIFEVGTVVLGGGTEKNEGEFISFVKESSGRFLLDERAKKLQIVQGALGKQAPAIGAASLCRRELFMEV